LFQFNYSISLLYTFYTKCQYILVRKICSWITVFCHGISYVYHAIPGL
jgi:hypothetical protein